jgi:hypothetical protein
VTPERKAFWDDLYFNDFTYGESVDQANRRVLARWATRRVLNSCGECDTPLYCQSAGTCRTWLRGGGETQ